MNKKEKIMAAIAGEAVDLPTAFWQPAGPAENDPAAAAERAYAFAEAIGNDLIITANGSGYSIEDCTAPDIIRNGGVSYIKNPADWERLDDLSLNRGALLREQENLKCLLEKTGGTAPVLFRTESPLSAAASLAPHIWEDIRRGDGDRVKTALRKMTETACALVERAIQLGADGIFFEAPLADYEMTEESLYREYGMPYDLAVLSASQGWCNAVRGGGADCQFSLLRKYPAQILAWNASQSLPTLEAGKMLSGKCVMAGINRRYLEFGMKNHIEKNIIDAIRATGGRGLILSAGAAVTPRRGMAAFFRKTRRDIEEKLRASSAR